MLVKLAKIVKKSFQGLGKKGYTLVEVAAVVAVTATLAAVVVPVALDKVKASKIATATDDVKALAGAIGGFYSDTGVWPGSTDTTPNYYQILRTGDETSENLRGDTDSKDPIDSTSGNTWSTGSKVGSLQDYLVVLSGVDYANFKGPYCESLKDKRDPWGHNYLVWVKGMYDSSAGYGWIISAGPNGTIDTPVSSDALCDGSTPCDDIGIVLYKARPE